MEANYLIPRTLKDLDLLVSNRLQESTTLEFKRELPASGKNDDIAADIAAMANTDGGVIIYGVSEKDGHACGLHPIPLSGSPERITQVAKSLDGPVALSEVVPLSVDAGQGYIVVVVPRSHRAPHFRNGRAVGRVPRGITDLGRRHVGELFAKSSGFAEEFGLRAGRPGRLKASPHKNPRPGAMGSIDYYLVFENDGDSDIHKASWKPSGTLNLPQTIENPFPMDAFPSHYSIQVRMGGNSPPGSTFFVETSWLDLSGSRQSSKWPISWL